MTMHIFCTTIIQQSLEAQPQNNDFDFFVHLNQKKEKTLQSQNRDIRGKRHLTYDHVQPTILVHYQ